MKKSILLVGVLFFGIGNGMDLQRRADAAADRLTAIIANRYTDEKSKEKATNYLDVLFGVRDDENLREVERFLESFAAAERDARIAAAAERDARIAAAERAAAARVSDLLAVANTALSKKDSTVHDLDNWFQQNVVEIAGHVQMVCGVATKDFGAVMADIVDKVAKMNDIDYLDGKVQKKCSGAEFADYIRRNGIRVAGEDAGWVWDDSTKGIICMLYCSPFQAALFDFFKECGGAFMSQPDWNNLALHFMCYNGIKNRVLLRTLMALDAFFLKHRR
ncbi:MAG: hypothetical protein LBJ96_03105 [Holosporaceae bacterium]|jgi:hypothetical protein|nr:hypothetical protein [Holosporaceae bacterium]